MNYAGDVTATETYERLQNEPGAILVDVRTPQELTYVGVPVVEGIGKKLAIITWHPHLDQDDLIGQLEAAGATADAPVYFLCRSGARSLNAAVLATHGGFTQAFNVSGGFEGPLDESGHRGTESGWKAEGLPWRQT